MRGKTKLLAIGFLGYVLATSPSIASAHSSILGGYGQLCRHLDNAVGPQSDDRYVKDKVVLASVIDKFKALKGYSFKARSYCGDMRSDIGLSAQEVEKVFPQAVYVSSGQKVISEERLMALVVQAIGELASRGQGASSAEIDAVKAEIKLLAQSIVEVKTDIDQLKRDVASNQSGQAAAEQRIKDLEKEQIELKTRLNRIEALLGIN